MTLSAADGKQLLLTHDGRFGFDHVTGDIGAVASAVRDRIVWVPATQRLARSHSALNAIRWDDVYDTSRFPAHIRLFEPGSKPQIDKTITVPYGTKLQRVVCLAASEDEIRVLEMRLSFVSDKRGVDIPRHPSVAVLRLAESAARTLGSFSMIHMRMTDKVGDKRYDPRCFNDAQTCHAIRGIVPSGSRLYLMTNQPEPRRVFPLICDAYEVFIYEDLPELAQLRETNYFLYQVEKSLLGLAKVAVANIRRLVPRQIGLWDLLPRAYTGSEMNARSG